MYPKLYNFCCSTYRDIIFRRFLRLFTIASLLLAACSPTAKPGSAPTRFASQTTANRPTRAGQLTPYLSKPTRTPPEDQTDPSSLFTVTPAPSPTATPRTHIVKKGEDMGGIAWQYRVSLEALMAANPTVQPNMMSIGTQLIIPPSRTQMPPESVPPGGEANPPTPTPIPVAAGNLSCTQVDDGGMWCFQAVRNDLDFPLEGLSAVFHVASQQSPAIVSQTAFLPLDRLEPGTWLPLAAYFPPEQIAGLTSPYRLSSELQTALPGADDGRYLKAHLENKNVMLSENGQSAALSADILLDSSGKANRVWVAAVAYGVRGNVVGVRRWENSNAYPLERGQALAVTMSVYSVSSAIDRVELFVEARP